MSNKIKSKTTLTSILKKTGFFMPTTEKDVEEYDKLFGNTDIILPQDIDNPDWLFKELVFLDNEESKKLKKHLVSNDLAKIIPLKVKNETKEIKNDYFKKLVLAAEITNQLWAEPTFGHVKFVKISYVCEEVCNMMLSTNYGKYAAGPFDPKHIHSVDAEFKKRKWFKVTKRAGGKGFKYEPDINIEDYKKYYPGYFNNQSELINRLIELFRKKSTDFCEIVATLFFVWKKAASDNLIIEDHLLISIFYDWGEQKKRFKEVDLLNAINWMRSEQIVPL